MVTETPSPDTPAAPVSDPTQPNIGAAVARVRARRVAEEPGEAPAARRGPGRPRGSKTRRTPSGRPITPAMERGQDDAPVEITEADIKGATLVSGVVWKLAGKFLGMRALTPIEARELGEAVAPVLAKYLPDMGEFAPEIGLALTVYGLYELTRIDAGERLLPEGFADELASTDVAPIAGA